MSTVLINHFADRARRIIYCLLPAGLGAGAALVLLLAASGAARAGSASQPTVLGCGATIQACIDAASPGSTIFIPAGDYTESLTLSQAVSLTGELSSTTILHALPNTRVLTVTGAAVDSSVVISGLTFTGGLVTGTVACPNSCGGGVLIDSAAQPTLSHLRLIGNAADDWGGGLYAGGAITVSDSQFINNLAGGWGGGMIEAGITSTARLINTDFTGNSAGQAGGGLGFNSLAALDVTGGSFVNNQAGSGGGITASGDATLSDTRLISNSASGEGGGLYAGAGLTLTGAQIVSNTSHSRAGGVFDILGPVSVTGSLFQANECSGCDGGGLTVNNPVTVSLQDSVFLGNQATSAAGVEGGYPLIMTDTQILSNTARDAAGGIGSGFVMATGGLFQGNRCTAVQCNGGGLYSNGTGLVASGTQFIGNSSDGSGAGAVVFGTATISQGLFRDNHCAQVSCVGGGLYAQGPLNITATQFVSNSQEALYSVNGSGLIVNSLFARNTVNGLDLSTPAGLAIVYCTIANPVEPVGAGISNANGQVGVTDTIVSHYVFGIQAFGGTTRESHNLFDHDTTNLSGPINSGGGSLSGDASFADPSGGDYHLSAGSAAVDSGTDVGILSDFDGEPRPQGAGFDMGFDEMPPSDVGVVISVSASRRQPGQAITYTLAFSNSGPYLAGAVRLTDTIPANLTAVTYTSSGPALSPIGGKPYAWQVADLPPGSGGAITVTGLLAAAPRGSLFTNTARIRTAYSDTNPANDTSVVTVTVANAPPVAAGDAYSLHGNHLLTVTVPGVLANDTDGNHDPLSAILVTGPVTGAFNLHADGSFTYARPPGFVGGVTFTYKANDGLADSNPATATITVGNAPPLAVNDAYVIVVNTTLTATAPGVLGNDTDLDADPMTALLISGPLTGTLNLHADGSFIYTPPKGLVGVVSFTYRANDGQADSNTATVTITVAEHKLFLPLVWR